MIISRCVTKKGETLWLKTEIGRPIIGRKEIAQFQFDRYLLKKEMKRTE